MDNNIKDERIQLRISKEQKHKLRVLASIHDMNISSYIIHLIEQDLKSNSHINSLINSCVNKVDTTVKVIKLEYTYDNKKWFTQEFGSMFTLESYIETSKKKTPIKNYRIIE